MLSSPSRSSCKWAQTHSVAPSSSGRPKHRSFPSRRAGSCSCPCPPGIRILIMHGSRSIRRATEHWGGPATCRAGFCTQERRLWSRFRRHQPCFLLGSQLQCSLHFPLGISMQMFFRTLARSLISISEQKWKHSTHSTASPCLLLLLFLKKSYLLMALFQSSYRVSYYTLSNRIFPSVLCSRVQTDWFICLNS